MLTGQFMACLPLFSDQEDETPGLTSLYLCTSATVHENIEQFQISRVSNCVARHLSPCHSHSFPCCNSPVFVLPIASCPMTHVVQPRRILAGTSLAWATLQNMDAIDASRPGVEEVRLTYPEQLFIFTNENRWVLCSLS